MSNSGPYFEEVRVRRLVVLLFCVQGASLHVNFGLQHGANVDGVCSSASGCQRGLISSQECTQRHAVLKQDGTTKACPPWPWAGSGARG